MKGLLLIFLIVLGTLTGGVVASPRFDGESEDSLTGKVTVGNLIAYACHRSHPWWIRSINHETTPP